MFCASFAVIMRLALSLILIAIMNQYQLYDNKLLLDLLSKSDEFADGNAWYQILKAK